MSPTEVVSKVAVPKDDVIALHGYTVRVLHAQMAERQGKMLDLLNRALRQWSEEELMPTKLLIELVDLHGENNAALRRLGRSLEFIPTLTCQDLDRVTADFERLGILRDGR